MVKAANVSVESYWPSLFAKLTEKRNIENLILNAGAGDGSAVVASAPIAGAGAGGTAAAVAPAAEEKKALIRCPLFAGLRLINIKNDFYYT